jgi:hypothetical protein
VRGRALFADGLPAGGIGLALRAEPARERGRTAGDGTFAFAVPALPARIVASSQDHVTLCAGASDDSSERDTLVVVARAVRAGGRVVDEHQRPLAGAHVRLALPTRWASQFGLSLERTEQQSWTTRSDAAGRFAFATAPAVAGSTLRAVLDGYDSEQVPAPDLSRDDLELVLRRPREPLSSVLRGRVFMPDGSGADQARVALGLTTALTDAQGFFHLDLARAVTAEQLRAAKQGMQPACLERPPGSPLDRVRAGWPEYVEIRLGPPALTLAGTVLDHASKPVADARVWVADGTAFGVLGHMPLSSEGLAAGALIPPQALETAARLPERDGDNFNDYRMNKPPATACWPYVTTDAGGSFTIHGLSARDYTLRILDSKTLQLASSGPHAAGARDVTVHLPAPDVFATLRGRVTCRGQPMANVQVAVRCTPFDARARTFGGSVDLRFEYPGSQARTDAQGRFALQDVPKERCHLVVRGETIVPHAHDVGPHTTPTACDIEVDARCQVQVKLRPPHERANAIAAVDAAGTPLDLLVLSAGRTNAYTDMPLHGGQSQVFALSSRASHVVLLKAGAPVAKIAVDLLVDVINVVEG